MTTTYQLTEFDTVIRRKDDVLSGSPWTYIPVDSESADYQKYLSWCASGNTPEPADVPVIKPVSEIFAWQGMLWIVRHGYEDAINFATSTLTGEDAVLARLMMSTANAVWRIDNKMVLMMLDGVLGLTAAQRGDAFIEASQYIFPM
jgi:hypothetical protein